MDQLVRCEHMYGYKNKISFKVEDHFATCVILKYHSILFAMNT